MQLSVFVYIYIHKEAMKVACRSCIIIDNLVPVAALHKPLLKNSNTCVCDTSNHSTGGRQRIYRHYVNMNVPEQEGASAPAAVYNLIRH